MDGLFDAYRKTSFFADTPVGRLCIRIDQGSPALDALLEGRGVTTWAYVTACNPGSLRLSDRENGERSSQLEREVQSLGYVTFCGEGIGDAGDWPAEASLLVLGISEAGAISLGREFGQLAVVCGEVRTPARLVRCGP